MRKFSIIVLTPAGKPDASMAIAASRAGELGILNLEYSRNLQMAQEDIERLSRYGRGEFGIKLDGQASDFLFEISSYLAHTRPERLRYVILTCGQIHNLRKIIRTFHELGLIIFYESICLRQAQIGKELGADGIVAKGHEAGGRIGEETAFVLLQKILAHLNLPVWVHGGVGLHTAASCYAAGAEGIVLDSQLLLAQESPLAQEVKMRLAALDGSETICLGEMLGSLYRVYARPNLPVIKELQAKERELAKQQQDSSEHLLAWRELISQRTGWQSLEKELFILGQDIAFAPSLAKKFGTVGGILQGIRRSISDHLCCVAKQGFAFREGSSLAKSHSSRYPIVQGPMARISDVPEFARQVAKGGALPFIELAMMRADQVDKLLARCETELAGLPWGVGMLGFIPADLFKEQMETVLTHRPRFALIAGGKPEQAKAFEQQQIATYLHCPSPGMLKLFLREGLKRFIFEGLECGGHLGPRSSFVLWESCLEVLVEFLSGRTDASSYQILLAGGIHDALSSLMAAMAVAPLVDLGVQVGMQVGSAYLFTEEAVSCGAIVSEFQQAALAAKGTIRLEAAPGYVTRCLATPFSRLFIEEKQKMLSEGRPLEEIRNALEALNLGRLRIAAKGIDRKPSADSKAQPQYVQLSPEEQRERGLYMIGQIAALRDRTSTIEALHQDLSCKGAEKLAEVIAKESELSPLFPLTWGERKEAMGLQQREPLPASAGAKVCSPKVPDIAIIGLACILPKAPDARTYWANIIDKVEAIEEIPPDRWDWRLYYHQDRKAQDKIYSKWGCFIDEVPFDPMEYGMPPNSLRSIEPLHLLTLQVVREAMKDAGYLTRSFNRERTSVILGAGGGVADLGIAYSIRSFIPLMEHMSNGLLKADRLISQMNGFFPEWTEDSFPGILMNVAAGRVANRFDLGGVNFTVDAACASSMAAVYLAVRELQSYSSDMVVVGGSDTMQNPFTYLCFSKTQALSPTGRSRPLDDSADGIVLGEGVAVVILKRLADAERDGDKIYAVIKAVGSSSDGRDKSLTAPRPEGQILALKRAYAQAGISPATIELIEAHSTGTVAGDRAEVQALSRVFAEAQARPQSCAIGSVKSMIGHTKCTAGVASLIKVAMALHSKILPPTLGVSQPNKIADFEHSPFYVNTEPRPWLKSDGDYPRRAGVSAFGFGGTNFHAVLEEYTQNYCQKTTPPLLYQRWPSELFLWEAQSKQELEEQIKHELNNLSKEQQGLPLHQAAFRRWEKLKAAAACPAREQQQTAAAAGVGGAKSSSSSSAGFRLAIVATSVEDLVQKLNQSIKVTQSGHEAVNYHDPHGIFLSGPSSRACGKIAFLFPGQGSQYPNMARDLALHFPSVRSCFEQMDQILKSKLPRRLSDYIFPLPVFTSEDKARQQKELTRTRIAQPAIGAASVALSRLLSQLEIYPDMVAGHSFGEYVALWAAGVLSEQSLMLLSEARGRIIEESADSCPGIMAAIKASGEQTAELISGLSTQVWIANYNSPEQTVISGTPKSVQQVVDHCKACGVEAKILEVACAFHSPLIHPARERFAKFLREVPMSEPKIPVYSNTTAGPHSSDPAKIADQMVRHLAEAVLFRQEIEAMYEAGARIFIEVGPKNVLSRLVSQILKDRPALSVALDQPGRSGLLHLQHCLGQIFVQGGSMNLDPFYSDRTCYEEDWLGKEAHSAGRLPSSTIWMVRGDRIRPWHEAKRGKREPSEAANSSPTQKPRQKLVESGQWTSTSAINEERAEKRAGETSLSWQRISSQKQESAQDVISTISRQVDQPYREDQGMGQEENSTGKHPLQQQYIEDQQDVVKALSIPRAEDQVMLQFQEMMSRFLDTQKEVMLRYLQSGRGLPATTRPDGQAATTWPSELGAQEPATLPHKQQQTTTVNGRGYHTASNAPAPPRQKQGIPQQASRKLEEEALGEGEFLTKAERKAALSPSEQEAALPAPKAADRDRSQETTTPSGPQEATSLGPAASQEQSAASRDEIATGAAASQEQIQQLLLKIVSERTGYPIEMLDLNLNMEADLGIDSIKRVEILGSFQREFSSSLGQSIEKEMENLSGAKTLKEIIDWIAKVSEQKKGNAESKQESRKQPQLFPHPEPGPTIPRFILEGVETPCTPQQQQHGAASALDKSKVVVITEDGAGLARLLATRLSEQGQKVALVRMADTANELQPGYYQADFGRPESVDSLLNCIRQHQGSIGALIHLYPFRNDQTDRGIYDLDLDQWKRQLRLEVKSLFYFARAVEPDFRQAQDKTLFMAVTSMGGLFGSIPFNGDRRDFSPSQGGCIGLIKSLQYEWPKVRLKAIDLNPQEDASCLVQHLLNEIGCQRDEVEVGYCHGSRFTLKPIPAPIREDEHSEARVQIDSSWIILISGGARGITADVAKELARRYQPTLILLGRSPLPEHDQEPRSDLTGSLQEVKARLIEQMKRNGEQISPARVEARYQKMLKAEEIRSNIKAIQTLGAKVYYYAVDVRDEASMSKLIDEIYQTFGRIDGLIHGAGIIEDKFIKDKTVDSFDRVFDTKADSAFILSRKIRFESLKFMVFFSSVAGRFGNRGQGDYAAANEVLNKLAIYLNDRWPGKIVSINWGPWENSNMVPPPLQAEFLKHGIQLISRADGPKMLDREICYGPKGEVEVILGGGGWEAALAKRAESGGAKARGQAVFPLFAPGIDFPPNEEGGIEIVRELDVERDLYLKDHRLDGKPVLPMTMALELMAEVAALGWPKWQISQARDLRVLQGIIVTKPTKVRIVATPLPTDIATPLPTDSQAIISSPPAAGPSISSNLVVQVEIQSVDKPPRRHYSLIIEMAKRSTNHLDWQPPALLEARPFPLSTREAYQQMLFHGPLFQGISTIEDIGANGIQGVLTPSDPQKLLAGNPSGSWLIDPVIMDCGLQMIILWSRTYWDMMPLPSRFRLFRILAPLSGSRIRFEGRILPQSTPGILHADLGFFTEEGKLIALLEDMEAACSKSLNRLAEKTGQTRGYE